MFGWLKWLSNDLGIDLGTANTVVVSRSGGIVLNEPSIVAVNRQSGKIEAIGMSAKEMLGKTPVNIEAILPLRDGVISDFDVTEQMLKYFIRQATNHHRFARPRIVIGVPSGITQVERRAVRQAAFNANAAEVYLVDEPMAAAIGANLPIHEPTGNMLVDIGGGTTDVAVISLSGIVFSKSIRIAGNEMDEAIIMYVKRKYNLIIGHRTAEMVKVKLGSAAPKKEEKTMEIKGRCLIEGIPRTIVISSEEVREALADTVNAIVDLVREALEQTPPELAADIVDHGIVLTGGGALLDQLDVRLRNETSLPVSVAEEPLLAVAKGVLKILNNMDLLRKVASPH